MLSKINKQPSATILLCLNSLAQELSAQGTVQKTGDLNGHPLLGVFLASDWGVTFGFLNITLHQLKSSLGTKGLIRYLS